MGKNRGRLLKRLRDFGESWEGIRREFKIIWKGLGRDSGGISERLEREFKGS